MIKMNKEKMNNNIKYIFISLSFLEIIIIKINKIRIFSLQNKKRLKKKRW